MHYRIPALQNWVFARRFIVCIAAATENDSPAHPKAIDINIDMCIFSKLGR